MIIDAAIDLAKDSQPPVQPFTLTANLYDGLGHGNEHTTKSEPISFTPVCDGRRRLYTIDIDKAVLRGRGVFGFSIGSVSYTHLVDYDSATFDSDQLGELLELCLEARVCGYDSLFIDPTLTRGGIVSLNITNIYDPAQFLIDRYINFPDKLYYAGFPGSSGCILPYSLSLIHI